ncbi:hypothetical protein COLO4_04693 [Corchorus olitorius]|uniref:Uncharacterized protein n=1 Tax=Corchorus olitorius TaxID=93759 RepID=A0A1R3KT40_9ROSI|nr:hypothetical protein COLO4_04693 [Corchorus olitorius]
MELESSRSLLLFFLFPNLALVLLKIASNRLKMALAKMNQPSPILTIQPPD